MRNQPSFVNRRLAFVIVVKLHHTLLNPDKAETVLLLHGMGSAGDDWLLQIPALAPHYRILAPDARGHGRSPRPPGPYHISEMAEDVAALMDQLEIDSAHAVGLSMGGAVALQLAVTRPSRVRSLVLVNAFAKVRPNGWRGFRRFLGRVWALQFGDLHDLGHSVIDNLFPKPEQAELRRLAIARFTQYNNDKAIYRAILGGVLRFDLRRSLPRIGCPTLVVAGDRDLTVPMICKHELARGIPNARLAVIADSGHATPIDQPERFNEVLLGFLREQTADNGHRFDEPAVVVRPSS